MSRSVVWLGVTAVGLALLAAWGLTLGQVVVPLDAVLATLTGQGTPRDRFVLLELRGPRILGAITVGALLAWSGLLLQGVFRNPLVSPDFIGIETGASAAAVSGIVFGVASTWIAPMAFVGAAGTALCLYALSWRGHLSGSRLVLVGVGANALLLAVVSFLLVRANVHQAAQAYQWMVGSLYSVTTAEAGGLTLAALVLGPLGLLLLPSLKVLQLGDVTARSLGLAVEATRLAVILVASALAAFAVAAVGPIGFVALAIPHAARLLAGPLSPGVYALGGLLGATFLLAADLAGQHLLPWGLPVGLLAAALGGPYFLFLLRRRDLVL